MEQGRQSILIDIDDTIISSSQEIIRQLNNKNKTNKTIEDLTDYEYKSIDPNITQTDIVNMYDSDEFFKHVKFNKGALQFIEKYEKIFDIIFISYGTNCNLHKKADFITECANYLKWNNIYFAACETGKCKKSDVFVNNPYLAIDNHIGHLNEMNAPKKILLKNNMDVYWNQPIINNPDIYVVNTFDEICQMIDFDLKLKAEGIFIDA